MDYEKINEYAEIINEGNNAIALELSRETFELEISTAEGIANDEAGEKNPAINDFLNSDFGSEEEQVIKKMMAAAAIASGSEAAPEEVASQADATAVSIKTAYKVSTGELDITESIEILIDQAAARLDTFIQQHIDMDMIGEKLVDVVSLTYPPAQHLKHYVKVVLKKVEPVVRKAITQGINTAASYAKKAVRTVSNKIKNFAKIQILLV